MNKTIKLSLMILMLHMSSVAVYAQEKMSDQELLDQTTSWLEKKININYYNAQSQIWWTNRFFFNPETRIINIKNTSSDTPSFLERGTYYDRKVNITDLDASSIQVYDIDEDKGRIVYGQVVQVNVIGNNKRIQRTKNSMRSFNEFFLQIPVPHAFDSARVTADSIKVKLALAINLASKIKPNENEEENISTVLNMLRGAFKGEDNTLINFNKITSNAYEIEHKLGDEFIREGLFGFDQSTRDFYLWTLNRGALEQVRLLLLTKEKISLETSDGNYQMIIHGVHHFSIMDQNQEMDYYRLAD